VNGCVVDVRPQGPRSHCRPAQKRQLSATPNIIE